LLVFNLIVTAIQQVVLESFTVDGFTIWFMFGFIEG
jgi:hypothetical protein